MNHQTHTLEITADNQPTVLERLLQVTRYRGFSVTGFTVFPSQDELMLDIKLTISSGDVSKAVAENGIQKLYNQLNKLFDINHVNLQQTETIQCHG